MNYLALKFAHVFIAIIAVGSSAALAVVLGYFADDPEHGAFALRLVRRLSWIIVIPGYVLMLVTGMFMGHQAGLLDARWTEAAMNLWGFGALFLGLTVWSLNRRLRGLRGAATLGRVSAVGWALVVVSILYFMVFKPT